METTLWSFHRNDTTLVTCFMFIKISCSSATMFLQHTWIIAFIFRAAGWLINTFTVLTILLIPQLCLWLEKHWTVVMLRLASITQTISTPTLVKTPSPTLTVVNCVGETGAAVSGPGSITMLTSSLASVTWDHLHQDPLTPPRLCQAGETVGSCHLTKILHC